MLDCKIFERVCKRKLDQEARRAIEVRDKGFLKYRSSGGIVQIGNCWIAKSLKEFGKRKLDQEARRAILRMYGVYIVFMNVWDILYIYGKEGSKGNPLHI